MPLQETIQFFAVERISGTDLRNRPKKFEQGYQGYSEHGQACHIYQALRKYGGVDNRPLEGSPQLFFPTVSISPQSSPAHTP